MGSYCGDGASPLGASVVNPAVVCGVVAVTAGLYALALRRLSRCRSHLGRCRSHSNVLYILLKVGGFNSSEQQPSELVWEDVTAPDAKVEVEPTRDEQVVYMVGNGRNNGENYSKHAS
jgi:hypothetical protein